MTCTRCDGFGFLNVEQFPDAINESGDFDKMVAWLESEDGQASDVQACDCCGDGEGWYGTPGEHNLNDEQERACYTYNGGLPECN